MRCVPVDEATGPEIPPLTVEVIRSARRKKTAQAKLIGNTVEVRIPARSTTAEESEFVDYFVKRFERTRSASLVDLPKRAAVLAKRYGLPEPASIRWATNQNRQWGSCTPVDATIRLSNRMAGFPSWVIDYVIVHELAHLVVADHGPRFYELVDVYPKAERARGYLIARDEIGA